MTTPLRVDPADIDAQRELGWPDFGPEDYCHRCGGPNPVWFVDSDRFNAAVGGPIDPEWRGIICPGCFVMLHEKATGLRSAWKLVPEMFRPIPEEARMAAVVEGEQ